MQSKRWLYLILLSTVVALSYSNTLHSPFVLDDFHTFVENPAVHVPDFSLSSLKKLSTTVFGITRFVPILTFAVDYHIGGGSVVQFHLTNIAVHIFCLIAVFFFLKGMLTTKRGAESLKIFSQVFFSLAGAALWALSPVQTNAVTYLVQRMTSIAALFYMCSLAFYIYGRLADTLRKKTILFLLALITALLAFLSKENSFTLPIAVLFVEFYFFSPDVFPKIIRSLKKKYWLLFILLFLLLVPFFFNFWQDIASGYRLRSFTLVERLLTEFRVVVFYISLLLLPLPGRLNLEHDFPVSVSIVSPLSTLFSLILLLIIFVFALRVRKSHPLISFGIMWFFLHLLIESTVIPLEIIFEHRLYLPSIGFFIVFISLLDNVGKKIATRFHLDVSKNILVGSVLVLVVCSAVLTYARNNDWYSPVTFYSDIVKKSPYKARPHSDLALALAEAGNVQDAIKHNLLAIELDPDYALPYNNLGHLYRKMGLFDLAIKYYQQALEVKPNQWQTYNNLGMAYSMKGMPGEAVDAYSQALALNANNPGIHVNLGDVYVRMGAYDKAIGEYQNALSQQPDFAEAYNKLGILFGKMGKIDKAIENFKMALRINPGVASFHHNIANAYMMKGLAGKAREHRRQAMSLQGKR